MVKRRSITITVRNFIDPPVELYRKDFGLNEGIWLNGNRDCPPDKIKPFEKVTFGSESDGFATGTKGYVFYGSSLGDFHIEWERPYEGSSGFGVDTPRGYSGDYTDISGNEIDVKVFIYKAV